jgi:DNA repair exonuclease SbcCD ATPase subunit
VELEPLKERAVQSEGLAGLSAELQKIAERSALLAEELTRVKQELEQQGKLGQDLTKLREEITDLSAVAGEIGRLQQKSEDLGEAATKLGARLTDLEREKDKVSQALEKSAQAIAALEARPAGAAGAAAPPPGDLAAKLKAVTAEMAEVKQALAQLQAEQPHLDVNIQDAKLVSQQDRTVIVCTLTVRNVSNRPNEITAVRAELDSGRDRMAPTSIRHWLPDGKQTNEERLILLPQKVLENSTTAPITLTAIGWPLEKSLESYAFRITVKDKSGNEYIKNHRLVPEPAS